MVVDNETVKREVKHYADEVRREMSHEMTINKAVLFGSYAKGCNDVLSDVDIAFFISNYGGKTRFEIGAELLRMTHNYNIYLEPLVFPFSEIDNGNPFVNEIMQTGQEV